MVPLRLDMTAHVRPASLRVEISNDEDAEEEDRLSFHAYASELLPARPLAKDGAVLPRATAAASLPSQRRCGLTLSNHLESVLAFQLNLSQPFHISTFDPAAPPSLPAAASSLKRNAGGGATTIAASTVKGAASSIAAMTQAGGAGGGGAAPLLSRLSVHTGQGGLGDGAASSIAASKKTTKSSRHPPASATTTRAAVTVVNDAGEEEEEDGVETGAAGKSRRHPSALTAHTAVTAAAPSLTPAPPLYPLSVVTKNFHSLRPSENVRASIGFKLTEDILEEVGKLRVMAEKAAKDEEEEGVEKKEGEAGVGIKPAGDDHHQVGLLTVNNAASPLPPPPLPPRGFQLVVDSEYEERLVIDKTLEVLFNNGDAQRLPVRAILHLPVLGLAQQEIDFGVSFLGQTCEAEVTLFNRSHCDAEWAAVMVTSTPTTTTTIPTTQTREGLKNTRKGERREAETESVFTVTPTNGFLSAFGKSFGKGGAVAGNGDCFETRLRVSFCPCSAREFEAVFEIGGKLGEAKRRLRVKGQGSRDEAHVALYQS